MVHTVHPAWGNRNCLRFGIYSEAMDDDDTNYTQKKNKRLRYCVMAGIIIVATLLVSKLTVFIFALQNYNLYSSINMFRVIEEGRRDGQEIQNALGT
jgi:hypothetical protein